MRRGNRRNGAAGGWGAVAATIALACFYLLTGPENHAEADDSFWFAQDVENAAWSELLDPHHLLYLPLARVLWLGARVVGVAERAYPVMVVFSALCAAAAVVAFGGLLRERLSLSTPVSLGGAGLLALSYGFWRFAAEAEVYSLAILLLTLFLYVALRRPDEAKAPREGIVSAVFGTLAVGTHILAVIPVLGAVPLYYLLQARYRRLLVYGSVCIALLLPTSLVAYHLGGLPEQSYPDYLMKKSVEDSAVLSHSVVRGVLVAPVGIGQILLASNFLLGNDRVYELISARFPNRMVEDERFTARLAPAVSRHLSPVTFSLSVTLLALTAIMVLIGLRSRMREPRTVILAVWSFLHLFVLVLYGAAEHIEAWFLALVPLLLLAGLGASTDATRRVGPPLLLALLGAMAMHNSVAGLLPLSDRESDRNFRKAEWLMGHASAGDLIVTADSPQLARYLRYWTSADVLDLQAIQAEAMDSVFSRHASEAAGHVYATGELFAPPRYFEQLRPQRWAARERLVMRLRPTAEPIVRDSVQSVYRIPR